MSRAAILSAGTSK